MEGEVIPYKLYNTRLTLHLYREVSEKGESTSLISISREGNIALNTCDNNDIYLVFCIFVYISLFYFLYIFRRLISF